jgi:putative membrane protein
MGLGFVVAKFGLFLRELSGAGGSATSSPFSEGVGVLLVLAGAALMAVAFTKFQRTRQDLEKGVYVPGYVLEVLLTAIMVAVGVALAVYLIASG